MQLKKIVDATQAFSILYNLRETSVVTSYKIKQIVDQINPHLKFFQEQIQKINNKFDSENTNLSKEQFKVKQIEIENLFNMDIKIKFKRFDIILNEDIKGLSGADIESLSPFINFKYENSSDNSEEIEL